MFKPPPSYYPERDRRRNRGLSTVTMALLGQVAQQLGTLERKPPATIALLALNIGAHLIPEAFPVDLRLEEVCLQPDRIASLVSKPFASSYPPRRGKRSWWEDVLEDVVGYAATGKPRRSYTSGGLTEVFRRLFLSALVHADDTHLYYNMMSLLWKGINLETSIGTPAFVWMVGFTWFTSHLLMFLISSFLYTSGLYGGSYQTCAVGFSAVLFALKYIWNSMSPGYTNVGGLSVPTKWAAWAELVVISLVTPNASFVGHLSGILAGALYLHGGKALAAPFKVLLWPLQWLALGRRRRYRYHRGPLGGGGGAWDGPGRQEDDPEVREAIRRSIEENRTRYSEAPTPYEEPTRYSWWNRAPADEDAEAREAMERSRREQQVRGDGPSDFWRARGPVNPEAVSADEIRRRRMDRFDSSRRR